MNDRLLILTEEYALALREYLARPEEAGLLRAYDLGRRMLALNEGVAELGIAHGNVLAAALDGEEAEAQAQRAKLAAEFLGEALAPFEMALRGYREANALLQGLNETLEERVKERAAALRESEERYRDLFENAGDLIQGATPDGRLLFVNRAWRTYLGFAPDEVAQLSLGDIVHSERREAFLAVCHRALAGESLERVESVFVTRDGRPIAVEGTVNCHYVEGRAVAVRGIFRDVTQRKRTEEEALKEASRRKDEFLAMLAHELRNPLAPLRNALHIMRLARHDAVEVGQARDMMERQVQHLVRLIDDLMDVSRITRGKVHLRKERIDLATVVHSAIEIGRPHFEAARHELTVVLPAGPVYVQADEARLVQVVANLLNNAAKYTEPGGHIRLALEGMDGLAVVRVRDTGIGIPAEMLPDIFGMFVQVHSSLERSQGGLGIGLTLVRSLVEMHGGSVEAHSAGPRQGSEFIVRLPVAPEGGASQEQERSVPENRPPDRSSALRLLVVDDNRESANSLGLLMKLAGHDVRVAYDGPAALELAQTFQPQVLLQDIQMPGMSGYEVARIVREQPATKNMLLVALTGYGSEEDRRRCREAGFDHHLVKPLDLCALEKLLASLGSLV